MGKKRRNSTLIALSAGLAGLVSSACTTSTTIRGNYPLPPTRLTASQVFVRSLPRSLDPLRGAFNEDHEFTRVVVLLSPSSPHSGFALDTLERALLEGFQESDFRLYVVWTDLLPDDDLAAAERASRRLTDRRIQVFHDSRRSAGRAFARGLLPVGAARDVYLFYRPGVAWRVHPPMPDYWSHQLGRVEEEHFYTNDELHVALRRSMSALQ